ncbi:MAG: tyrosine-type recombinase/integrase [Clostridiales bacterium]|jgi:site-specific recombinase XerD|nr:tyrosine-type recombinase/integrase [Clostridiales bacterium]
MEYKEEQKQQTIKHLREHLKELPQFLGAFFRAIADTTAPLTRHAYAHDLTIFFRYLSEELTDFESKPIAEFTLDDLRKITPEHIEAFMEYLDYYVRAEGNRDCFTNGEQGKSRKLSALRTMFSYFYKHRQIDANPSDIVDFPTIHKKNIIRLDVNEVAKLLDEVESGEHLTTRQRDYHAHTKERDLAVISLLLGTGMRVSECVGVNVTDLDFDMNAVKVTRKGGDETLLYFSEEVAAAVKVYADERGKIDAKDDDALFLSLQKRRMHVRTIENLVKKYTRLVTTVKHITPHKLRSTFGTQLYQETGDIYLVADALGHADINTTRKHYAAMDEARRKSVANHIKLRRT